MPTTKALAILTLAAATLGMPGCRSCGEAGQFFGAVLGTAAAVMLDSQSDDDWGDGYQEHHDHHAEHRCRRHR